MKETPILFTPANIRAILEDRKTQTRRVMPPVKHLGWTGYMMSNDKTHAIECGPDYPDDESDCVRNPYGVPGDRLWVREGWKTGDKLDRFNATEIAVKCIEAGYEKPGAPLKFLADGKEFQFGDSDKEDFGDWGRIRSGRFMPKWVARLWLEITDVRVERVQDISEKDAIAEGIYSERVITDVHCYGGRPVEEQAERFWSPKDSNDDDGCDDAVSAYAALWDSINGLRYNWSSNPWVWCIEFRRVTWPNGTE